MVRLEEKVRDLRKALKMKLITNDDINHVLEGKPLNQINTDDKIDELARATVIFSKA